MSPWIILLLIVAGGAVVAASVVPLPSVVGYNVSVTVGFQEVSYIIQNYFSITSVQGQTNGAATLLDWGGWFAGLNTGPPALEAQFSATVCVGGTHCSTKTASQWFPTVPFINGASLSSSDTFNLAQVPGGTQQITVTLSQSGSQVASGSGSMCVGC